MNSIIDKIDAPRFWRIANHGYKLQQLSLKMKFDDGYRAKCQRRTKVRINPDSDGGLVQIPFGVIVIRNFVKTIVAFIGDDRLLLEKTPLGYEITGPNNRKITIEYKRELDQYDTREFQYSPHIQHLGDRFYLYLPITGSSLLTYVSGLVRKALNLGGLL